MSGSEDLIFRADCRDDGVGLLEGVACGSAIYTPPSPLVNTPPLVVSRSGRLKLKQN